MIQEQARTKQTSLAIIPFFVDGLALFTAFLGLSSLSSQLVKPLGLNALIFVVLYILFCIGVYLIRKLRKHHTPGGWLPPELLLDVRVRGFLAFLFGLLMVTTVAYQLDYFASIQAIRSAGLDEGASSSLFVYMPGALLGFSMLYILVLAFRVQDSVTAGSRRALVFALLGLGLVNSMMLLCAAQAAAWLSELTDLNGIWKWLFTMIMLLISFAPPRILYQDKYSNPTNVLSFSALLMMLSWLVVSSH